MEVGLVSPESVLYLLETTLYRCQWPALGGPLSAQDGPLLAQEEAPSA